jgi:hypothetical protein
MATENLSSTLVTNLSSKPSKVPLDADYGGELHYYQDSITTTETTGSNTSTYLMLPIASNARIKSLSLQGVGSVDLPDVDVGLSHESGDTTLIDDDCLATALDIDDTGDHFAINPNTSDGDGTKQVWEYVSGLTKDPGGLFYVMLSLDADAVAAGKVVGRMEAIIP